MNWDSTMMAGAGFMLGAALTFYQVDTPRNSSCNIPVVTRKVVTAYVLKPPAAEVRYEACPQTTSTLNALEPSPIVQPKPEEQKSESQNQTDETVEDNRHHRRHRRHWRHRRYW